MALESLSICSLLRRNRTTWRTFLILDFSQAFEQVARGRFLLKIELVRGGGGGGGAVHGPGGFREGGG